MYSFINAHTWARHLHRNEQKRNHWTETQRTEEKEAKCIYIYRYYNEFPREEEPLGFGDEELCPPRRRDPNDKPKSLDEENLSHSEFKHWSSVGLSDERIDKHCSINCTHSRKVKKTNKGQCDLLEQ